MRLWTLHPHYLDSRGLVALWREALLAQTVLGRGSGGYQRHPQLQRFREHRLPIVAIAAYLRGVADEAERRGYAFDNAKIGPVPEPITLEATSGQLAFEWEHLTRKLQARSPGVAESNAGVIHPDPHPIFRIVDGPVAVWERVSDDG